MKARSAMVAELCSESGDVEPNISPATSVHDNIPAIKERSMTILGSAQAVRADWLQRTGAGILRWSLVFLLMFFGALKWTPAEAQAIAPFVSHSPFLRWVTVGFGPQSASEVIGIFELITGLLLAAGQWAPRLGFIGGVLGIAMFVTTLSFLVTTPNLGDGVGFLLKDFTLLGAATWLAGEAAVIVARQT
jgi:uncharacterized membrane protein YkgB